MILLTKRKLAILAAAAALLAVLLPFLLRRSLPTAAPYSDESAQVPIIMYHALMENTSRSGEYVITPEQLESDFCYLRERGYTPISFSELYEYTVDPQTRLPEKCVMITFDDGYYNNYIYGFPLLKRYAIKCLISPIGIRSEMETDGEKQVPAYSHLRWEQIKEMYESGLVEFGNHTYNMHELNGRYGIRRKAGESESGYRQSLYEDIEHMQTLMRDNTGIEPNIFVYPFGAYSGESEKLLDEMGFTVSLTCEEGINIIAKGSSLRLLKRYNRPAGKTSEEFFGAILNISD